MESNHCKLPPNPRESANILSIVFFTWTLPIFKKGYEKILKLGDIFRPLNSDKSDRLGDQLEMLVFLNYYYYFFSMSSEFLYNFTYETYRCDRQLIKI